MMNLSPLLWMYVMHSNSAAIGQLLTPPPVVILHGTQFTLLLEGRDSAAAANTGNAFSAQEAMWKVCWEGTNREFL